MCHPGLSHDISHHWQLIAYKCNDKTLRVHIGDMNADRDKYERQLDIVRLGQRFLLTELTAAQRSISAATHG